MRGKIRLPKVEQSKFEDHMTTNKDKYQKLSSQNLDIHCLSIIICILA